MATTFSTIKQRRSFGGTAESVLYRFGRGMYANSVIKAHIRYEYSKRKETSRPLLAQNFYKKKNISNTTQKDAQTSLRPAETLIWFIPGQCQQCGKVRLNGSRQYLEMPNRGYVFIEYVLSRLEQGDIGESSFRYFLNDLESTPLGSGASQVCDKLYQIIKRNIGLPEDRVDERVALGCAIRKLIFNLTDDNLPQVTELLQQAKESRDQDNATSVELLLYKALVDRFESHPFLRDVKMRPIADMCYKTIVQFGETIGTKSETTQVVFVDALLGFACYATEDKLAKSSFRFDLPRHLYRFVIFMGENIQDAIRQKMPENCLYLDIFSFIGGLTNKNNYGE